MLDVIIPRSRYNTDDYPNMEEKFEGSFIPLCYGPVKNITPVLIDSANHTWKVSKNTLSAIDAVRADGETLVEDTDYSTDLADGEFSFITGSPLVSGGSTYYIIFKGDYALSTSDYMWVVCNTSSTYADGTFFWIDGADAWTDKTIDAQFEVYGRKVPNGAEEIIVSNGQVSDENHMLRYDADRTKFAQSIQIPGTDDYYITKIRWRTRKIGSPSGDVWLEVHSDQAGTIVGSASEKLACADVESIGSHWRSDNEWSVITADDVRVDATGEYDNVADIIEDVAVNEIGVPSSYLDATSLAALKAEKTQQLSIYLNYGSSFGEFLEKLEVGQLFKTIPGLEGKLLFEYYESGEPAGTPHLRDEDIEWLTAELDISVTKSVIEFEYKRDPTNQTYSVVSKENEFAKFFYSNEESLLVQSFLYGTTAARAVRDDYSDILKQPHLKIRFETSYDMFELYPSQKVKITYSRAPYSGGEFDGVLFRILRISKRPASTTCEVTAVLDTHTYAA